jgi:glycerophosphoryl diester phosphodiesterase
MSAISTDELRRRNGGCRIIAHRGYSSDYPENTVDAYEAAISAGADLIEVDLRLSRDEIVVCHHDPVTAMDERIEDLTAETLSAGGVAIFAEVLPALRARVPILLDLKVASGDLAREAIGILRDNGMLEQTVIGVRSVRQTHAAREASDASVLLGFLADYDAFSAFFDAGGDIARLWEHDCSADRVTAARCGDHPVWVTVGGRNMPDPPGDIDTGRLRTLFELGVDGVLVNDPVFAMDVRAGGRAGNGDGCP